MYFTLEMRMDYMHQCQEQGSRLLMVISCEIGSDLVCVSWSDLGLTFLSSALVSNDRQVWFGSG